MKFKLKTLKSLDLVKAESSSVCDGYRTSRHMAMNRSVYGDVTLSIGHSDNNNYKLHISKRFAERFFGGPVWVKVNHEYRNPDRIIYKCFANKTNSNLYLFDAYDCWFVEDWIKDIGEELFDI